MTTTHSTKHATDQVRVGLLVTCLVDLFRPSVGFAAVKLLEQSGCLVDVPLSQTCCGQPAYNSGDEDSAREIARNVIESFEEYDYVVAPSGSCSGMASEHYPELFANEPNWHERATRFSAKCHELISFLTDVLHREPASFNATFQARCTYHDSCSGLRELNIHHQPRYQLGAVDGLSLVEMKDSNVCCGFGGTFCVKYPEISARMVSDKLVNISASRADTLLGGDLGCLMNIAGRLSREGANVQVYHVAEVLADMASDTPPIGQTKAPESR